MQSFFAEDPEVPADRARIFWDAMTDPSVMRINATAATSSTPGRFNLFELAVDATILVLPDREELLLGHGNRTIRISSRGASFLSGSVSLEFGIASCDPLIAQSSALQRFATFRLSRLGLIGALRAGSAAKRLAVLKTIDALARDSRHRQVAIALFGADQVDRGWDTASDHLRSKVRRLIRQARALIGGKAPVFPPEPNS